MRNKKLVLFIFFVSLFIFNMNFCYAEDYLATIKGTGVNLRSGPGTNYSKLENVQNGLSYKMVNNTLHKTESDCINGWYQLYYGDNQTGYICSDYVIVSIASVNTEISEDIYYRPWTSPKAAILGGAKFITESYINAGQFTSYLKKFNVNPDGKHNVYNHQYMANLRAPYSEAYSGYKSYLENKLLELPLEFTIPVFENMPDYTILPGTTLNNLCQSEITDNEFEALLNDEGFPESYKCKLRTIHNSYSNWTFKAMHTNLDFDRSVKAEQIVSSIQGGDIYYDLSSGNKIETESGWYQANYETVAYFLDPRNFLIPERILMFENLAYSANYTETVVQSILKGTFMEEYSFLDNESYAKIFVEAGEKANISAVYLASLARQESGVNGSKATSGAQFSYKGIIYKGVYNFFNIGANSSAESPVLAGLVWASGGSDKVIVIPEENIPEDNPSGEETEKPVLIESSILEKLGAQNKNNCLVNLTVGTLVSDLKNELSGLTVSINSESDNVSIKTGQEITITDGITTFTYTIVISGDVDGDGGIGATDYVKIKNYIMEKSNSELNLAQSLAADVDNNGEIGATDYVKIKNSIMEG